MRARFVGSLLPFALLAPAASFLSGCKGCSDQGIVKDEDVTDTEAPPAHDIGAWLSLGVLPDGRPVASYEDRTKGGLGFAVGTISGDTATWVTEEVDGFPDENGLDPGDQGRYTSLAVAADGTVWIAHQDATNGVLKYARRAADGTWTTGLADTGGGSNYDSGYWASIALDGSGNPVIAHYDKAKGDLRVARWNGTAFTGSVAHEGEDVVAEDGTTISGDAGAYCRLRIAPDGTEYIAFHDAARGALMLAKGGASGFTAEIVDDTGNVGQWPDFVIEGVTLKIAYQDVGDQDLEVAYGTPGAWSYSTVDAGDHVGADTVAWADGSDIAIAYFDGVNNDLKLARRSSDAWSTNTVTGGDAARGYHNEAIVVDGRRWIGSYDYTARAIWFAPLP
jgi:hypothetical protein